MDNAVKFTDRGSITVTVSVINEGDDSTRLRFAVEDTGIGIPEARQPHLFTKFTQADASTARRYGGTGLGLAISKHIVECMGGEIDFESREGRGSSFWFVAPLRRGAPEATGGLPTGQGHAARRTRQPPLGGGLRILVAEDKALFALVIGRQTAGRVMPAR